ncbi:MAG: hypothetical protein ACRD1S_00650 [Vicinamibacterales bacterium]
MTLSSTRVPVGAPLEITYRFDVAPGTKIDDSYRVFVHFLDSEGERMWGDDHTPVPPTPQWSPGRKVEYKRLIWLPIYPYTGETRVRIGLYTDDGRRLPLGGNDLGRREYEVATFTLQPQSENIFLIFKDGWHAAESLPDQPNVTWEWTKKTATLAFRNPKQDVVFFLEADGRTDVFTPPQQATIVVNDQSVHTITMERDPKLHRLPITAAQLGTGDMVELKIQTDRAFTPAAVPAGKPGHGSDTRELGVRVYHAFVATK